VSDDVDVPVVSERPTFELCGEEFRRGVRCILPRGHDAPEHECPLLGGYITWKPPAVTR
jgi:hypothetical protein